MIKFFGKIRQNLLNEGRLSKYLLYAIGEIILIVIGILIALQLNNWNEKRKQEIKRDYYLSSLLANLNENISYLKRRNGEINSDSQAIQDVVKRIGSPTATIDTIIKIAHEEVSLLWYAFAPLNDNTYQTLLSTGHIEYLDPWLQEELQQLNFKHNDLIKTNETMRTDYGQVVIDFLKVYPLNGSYSIVTKQQADLVLTDLSNAQKIGALNNLLWIKGGAEYSTLQRSESLEESMIWLADTLLTEYPFLKNNNN
ncbi:MAG: DUF6090 family protein [Ignavibacteria bacterium]|jgi:hypothetical protein